MPPPATRPPRPGRPPGGQPGQPISAFQLTERLRQLGIHSGQARSAALLQLATDLPAAILARLPGIYITVAVAWQRASAGDRAAYAAEASRRSRNTQEDRATHRRNDRSCPGPRAHARTRATSQA
jgi:hypothetical protein